MKRIEARPLKSAIRDGAEIALIDVREEPDYFHRHLLYASCVPFGRLEPMIDDLLPRRSVRVVMIDSGEGHAERAAARLESFGYSDISVLNGGIEAWAAEGFELFSGMHVPSKAFGEYVDAQCKTARISPDELHRRLSTGEDILILDSRPFDEFSRQSIPGGVDCPGAELAYRIYDLVQSPKTLVVVNCAGRTRSIIGTQSLINAGIQNQVVALTNGTMGWHLAGLPLAKGEVKRAPAPSQSGVEKAQAAAQRVADAAGVCSIKRSVYKEYLAERSDRTLYVFDVREPEEFEAGHLPDSISAPGGQLIQETDRYAPTRNARIVLIDDTGVRARMTGAWLRQMGWNDVAVLERALEGEALSVGRRRARVLGLETANPPKIQSLELRQSLEAGEAVVLDFSAARRHRGGHIPGSYYALRSNLPGNLGSVPAGKRIVVTSTDGLIARFAASEISSAVGHPVAVLAGGTQAWRKAGFPMEKGCSHFLDEPQELWTPYGRLDGSEAQMNAYLTWEVGLSRQIERDGDCHFRITRPGGSKR